MWILILGLVIFFGIHSVRMVASSFREARLATNERAWKGVYSLVSAIGLGLIIWGWILYRGDAPQIFEPPAWGRHAAMALVLVAFILLASYKLPPGRIRVYLKHPFLVGIMLWSIGHLLVNGDLASLLLFGSFLVYAVANRMAVIPRGNPAPVIVRPRSDLIAVVSGIALYIVFVLWLHGWLFGVSPIA